jgi:PAS domain S-box-containing protein
VLRPSERDTAPAGLSARPDPPSDPDDVALARFMADAGRILGASLDIEDTLREVAQLAVPTIADWCAIDLLGADGTLRSVAIAHQDPARVALVEALAREYPADPASPTGPHEAVRQRRSISGEVTPEMLAAVAQDERHARLIAELDLHAWMIVPMLLGERVLGTIAFVAAESGRTFGPRHVAFAEHLALRAGVAIDNARSFHTADRFRRILDTVAEAVFVLDGVSGEVRDVNKGALDLLASPPDRLVGRPWWMHVEGLDAETARGLIQPLVDDQVEERTIDLRVRPLVGPAVPVEVLVQRMDLPGEPGAIVAIARDISERVEAQGRLHRLAEAEHARAAELNAVIRAIGDGVVVCQADGTVRLANPAAMAILGLERLDHYRDIVRAVDGSDILPALGTHGDPTVVRATVEPETWIEITTYPVAVDSGRGPAAMETIVVLRDVTAARQREAIRETFIGVLSHELRTPITTIYGGAKLLARRESNLDESTRRSIFEDIVAESERLQRLVEDVVAMNRFGESSDDLGREPVLLQRVVPAVVESEQARWPGVDFDVRVPPGTPTVVADPVYVEQTLRNLLSNAAKYSGPASHVEIDVAATDDEVLVRILDDGPGIERDEAERVFDLFYRSPNTARDTAGAGIGLFVCARLVQAMGGRIWARPRATGGAEFGFALGIMAED